jgi:hypothetical protein
MREFNCLKEELMARNSVNRAHRLRQKGSKSWNGTVGLSKEVVSKDLRIGACIKAGKVNLSQNKMGKRKDTPGRIYEGKTQFVDYEQAEYLYLSNGYIARGVDTEASAIIRNGIQIVPTNKADQNALDKILEVNDIELLIYNIARNVCLYGKQWVEKYDDPFTETVKFTLLPVSEMDYLRDKMYFVLFDKRTGEPAG